MEGRDILSLEAAASFGLEAIVRGELEALGVSIGETRDRRVLFEGTAADIARCNIRLRTADRVWLRLAEFSALDFDDLYEGVRGAPWKEILPRKASVVVKARSSRSRLSSVPSLQSVSKKAIVDAILGGRGRALPTSSTAAYRGGSPRPSPVPGQGRVDETGPQCTVEVSVAHDRASVCLDTTGPGLHKRGYRVETGAAPLRENLAAALVLLSRWDATRPFADPLCGSGTIPIEAALLARGAAPGVNRSFAAEDWPALRSSVWQEAREEARAGERRDVKMEIEASDRDPAVVEAAGRNAAKAGVSDCLRLRRSELASFTPSGDYGCVVTNPPYGERLGDRREVDALARHMGDLYRRLGTWSFFVLTANADFPRLFGSPFSKNRKLYNGDIRCYLYQYFRPRQGGRRSAEAMDGR